MKLHMLLALLSALVVMATAQNDPRDFEVLEDQKDPDDIDSEDMKELQASARTALRQLNHYTLNRTERQAMRRARGNVPLAPGYTAAMEANLSLFGNSSVSDVLWPGPDTTTTTTTTTPSPISSNTTRPSRGRRDIQTSLYLCPHRNYLLTWFLGSNGRICFVPWAWNQAITYARCSSSFCSVRFWRPNTGRCRPSCFSRRSIFSLCFHPSSGTWTWRWETKNLPQACRCSSC